MVCFRRDCACQGWDKKTAGASYSFGCGYQVRYTACKFARSENPRKFKLEDERYERELEDHLQKLATDVAPLLQIAAPDAYKSMVNKDLF